MREKELREKDILIQDNLIRFSSFLSQQDTRKTKDLEAAKIERDVSPILNLISLGIENRRKRQRDVDGRVEVGGA